MQAPRRVLVVAGTVTSTMRLVSLLALVESDQRVQVVFTHDEQSPSVLVAGVPELLAALQVMVIPWNQATGLRFDLILTASEKDRVHLLDGPAVLFPHGAGHQKYDVVHRGAAGLSPEHLLHNGKAVHAAVALAHPEHRELLAASCPDALDRAVVVGDPCLDTMLASQHRRARYRDALGVGVGERRLLVLTSTWGPQSLLGQAPDLPQQMLAALPYDGWRVCLLTHPGIVAVHGQRQLDAWLAGAERMGLMTIPASQRWEPVLLSADCVVADQGSMSLYTAAMDIPLLLAGGQPPTTLPGSPVAELAARAPRLGPVTEMHQQIESVIADHQPGRYADIVARTMTGPGTAAVRLRRLLFRVMELAEPRVPATLEPLPLPVVSRPPATAFSVTTQIHDHGIAVDRRPVTTLLPASPARRDQHLVAHALDAPRELLREADVVYTTEADVCRHPDRFLPWAATVFRQWPHAALVAAVLDERTCRVVTADDSGFDLTLSHVDGSGFDPLLLASVAYLHHRREHPVSTGSALLLRGRAVTITVDTTRVRGLGSGVDCSG